MVFMFTSLLLECIQAADLDAAGVATAGKGGLPVVVGEEARLES
jgi:hypothetical protein